MSQVLLTGASGFIGGHLAARLVACGDEVRCLVRTTSKTEFLESLGVELVYGDLTPSGGLDAALRDREVVYHLAGLTSAYRSADLWCVNAEGTAVLVSACARQAKPPIVVLVSSLAAAGPSRSHGLRTERDPPSPISDYGRSKRGGERAAAALADIVPTSVVRPGIVFGQRDREMLPIFRAIYRTCAHAIPTYSPPRLSLIHQEDLIDILIAVAERGTRIVNPARNGLASGRGYYFANDAQILTYEQLGRAIAEALGRPDPLMLYVPEPLLWLAAAGNQLAARWRGRSDSFNPDKIREATAGHWAASTERVQHELQLRPAKPLAERFRETTQWYLEHGWL